MVDDGQLQRLQHDLERVATSVRALENLEAPMQSRAVTELRELQKAVARINEQGALATRGQVARIRDRLSRLEEIVKELGDDLDTKADAHLVQTLMDDRKSLVRMVFLAVVAAVLSLVAQLIAKALGAG